jgi:hypothetical protein
MSDEFLVVVHETNNAVVIAALGDKAAEELRMVGVGSQLHDIGEFGLDVPTDCGRYVWTGELAITTWSSDGIEADDREVIGNGTWRPATKADHERFGEPCPA